MCIYVCMYIYIYTHTGRLRAPAAPGGPGGRRSEGVCVFSNL